MGYTGCPKKCIQLIAQIGKCLYNYPKYMHIFLGIPYIIPDKIIMGDMENGVDLKINIVSIFIEILDCKINYAYMYAENNSPMYLSI